LTPPRAVTAKGFLIGYKAGIFSARSSQRINSLSGSVAGVLVVAMGQASQSIPKDVPKEGEIPYGEVVLVDDGTCPKGQVKEITGGNREKSIPRKSRCIRQPAQAD
jgi:hypothetical protein